MIPSQTMISFDTKTSITSFIDDLSVLSDITQIESQKNNVIFCPECWEIPRLSKKSSNNKIISNCKENNHYKEYKVTEFVKNVFLIH